MNIKTSVKYGNPIMMCHIKFHQFFAYLVIGSSFFISSTYAGPGHDHGEEEANTTLSYRRHSSILMIDLNQRN